MIAVQRPSMGSSKPPHLDMPFGYSFDNSTSNFPFPSPTAPAPGPSLLDDNESKFLDSFFDGVSSDQFNYDFFNNAPDGSELGLGWEELPPTFMGTTSSFGQQPQMASHSMANMNYGGMNTHLSSGQAILPSASADVLAAATLLQNGSTGRSYSMADANLMGNRDPQMQPLNVPPRAQSLSQPISRMPQQIQPQASRDDFVRDTLRDSFYSDMIFGSQSEASRQRGVSQKVDIRWGSDAAFNTSQGFMAPPGPDSVSATERYHIQTVENALIIGTGQIPSSTDTTQPSSPVVMKTPVQPQRTKSTSQTEEEDQDSRPRKRRKSKFPDEDEDDEDFQSPVSASNKPSMKKRKSIKKEAEQPPDTEAGQKRRKSTAAATAKAARENLTEEQKRENHIKSEQKRRTLIREGFEDLGELVPGLQGGGFSKSAVLIMAADWLEELIQGNEVLKAKLDQMEGRS